MFGIIRQVVRLGVFSVTLCFFVACFGAKEAVFIYPVCDLYSRCPAPEDQKVGLLPATLCWSGKSTASCLRVSQGLYGEVVEVVGDTGGDYVQVRQLNLFHQGSVKEAKVSTFWCARADFCLLESLPKDLVGKIIPKPISYEKDRKCAHEYAPEKRVVQLKVPCQGLSAGTRLPIDLEKSSGDYFVALVYDPIKNKTSEVLLPKTDCTEPGFDLLAGQKQAFFVGLLNKWRALAQKAKGRVPYLWGGRSLDEFFPEGDFEERSLELNSLLSKSVVAYWTLRDQKKEQIKPSRDVWSGCDCSSLVVLAASIAKVPGYFCKTTTTIRALGTPLERDAVVKPGSLLWAPGHVMVLDGDDLIETSGYSSGYGGFHKVPLCKRFKGVEGVVDLQDKLREGKKITYLTKSGLESGNPVEGCIYPLVQSWGA